MSNTDLHSRIETCGMSTAMEVFQRLKVIKRVKIEVSSDDGRAKMIDSCDKMAQIYTILDTFKSGRKRVPCMFYIWYHSKL